MTRNLDSRDTAYNACVDALNEAEDRMQQAAEDRIRAWDAAEALHGLRKHGRRQTPRAATPGVGLGARTVGTWKRVR